MAGLDIKICWICNARPATTREHKVLKSRLDLHDISDGGLIVSTPDRPRPTIASGTKSSSVKFGKTLCNVCNGDASQEWDFAYLDFIKIGLRNPDFARNRKIIPWTDTHPGLAQSGNSLARYYAKAVGCRLINKGLSVPGPILDFLRNDSCTIPFSLCVIEDYNWLDTIEKAYPSFRFPIVKLDYSLESESDHSPSAVIALFHEGPYGILFSYDPTRSSAYSFTDERHSRVFSRTELADHYQSLWKTQDIYLATVQKFILEDRIDELKDSSDHLNILGTHN